MTEKAKTEEPKPRTCWTASIQSVTVGPQESIVKLSLDFVQHVVDPEPSINMAFSFTPFIDFKIPHWFFPGVDPRDISARMVSAALNTFFETTPFEVLPDPAPDREEGFYDLPPALRAKQDEMLKTQFISGVNPNPFEEPGDLDDVEPPAGLSGRIDRNALRREFGHGPEDNEDERGDALSP